MHYYVVFDGTILDLAQFVAFSIGGDNKECINMFTKSKFVESIKFADAQVAQEAFSNLKRHLCQIDSYDDSIERLYK